MADEEKKHQSFKLKALTQWTLVKENVGTVLNACGLRWTEQLNAMFLASAIKEILFGLKQNHTSTTFNDHKQLNLGYHQKLNPEI